MLLGATVLLGLFALDGTISRVDGGALVLVYVIYVLALLAREQSGEGLEALPTDTGVFRAWLLLVVGLAVVALASELTVRSVVAIAETFGLQETLIAALIIGLGTSLPELAISINAVLRKRVSLSVGNIVGSNIFDTLVPIGAAGIIAPLAFDRDILTLDLPWLFGLTVLVLVLFLVRRRGLQRPEAALLLALYAGYVVLKLTT
jgi:cation:H+ antiporter